MNVQECVFVLIDMQERLMPVISEKEKVIKQTQIMLQGAHLLKIPTLVTEQYPQGLGPSLPPLKEHFSKDTKVLTKTTFSCFKDAHFKEVLKAYSPRHLILAGVETHICVLKTALDALDENLKVHLLCL